MMQHKSVGDRELVQITIGDTTLEVEAVTTPSSITQGLSGRSEIGSEGMLFVMPDRRVVSFWMPDMQFDLDMVWIDGGTIAGITSNVPKPAPGQGRDALPSYSSIVPVTHVLEIPAGRASELGLLTGQTVQIQSQLWNTKLV